jgi:hypothetical protein
VHTSTFGPSGQLRGTNAFACVGNPLLTTTSGTLLVFHNGGTIGCMTKRFRIESVVNNSFVEGNLEPPNMHNTRVGSGVAVARLVQETLSFHLYK